MWLVIHAAIKVIQCGSTPRYPKRHMSVTTGSMSVFLFQWLHNNLWLPCITLMQFRILVYLYQDTHGLNLCMSKQFWLLVTNTVCKAYFCEKNMHCISWTFIPVGLVRTSHHKFVFVMNRDNFTEAFLRAYNLILIKLNHNLAHAHYCDVIKGRDCVSNHQPHHCLLNRLFIQAQIKENIKAPRDWPLCGEFTGDRWITRTNGQ